jgi:uncharacterized protein (DUF1330 family)
MTVYIINNMTIHDPDAYRTYLRGFRPIFEKYGGSVLAAQDAPAPLEGTWPYERTVLLSFPSRRAFAEWVGSAEYQTIAAYRRAGTTSNVIVLDGIAASSEPAGATATGAAP